MSLYSLVAGGSTLSRVEINHAKATPLSTARPRSSIALTSSCATGNPSLRNGKHGPKSLFLIAGAPTLVGLFRKPPAQAPTDNAGKKLPPK